MCIRDSGKSVLFKNAASLSTELSEAKDNYALGKLEKRIQKVDLLIIDEMGYVSFDRFQSELLFKVIAEMCIRDNYREVGRIIADKDGSYFDQLRDEIEKHIECEG